MNYAEREDYARREYPIKRGRDEACFGYAEHEDYGGCEADSIRNNQNVCIVL
ncbi:hypothetical protein BACUNI_00622 [Bacteroides uniformis ATCC 8492]|uniref:Uncharacterized protein n=1 Tax=Bacteroides uniformis (strain ATCC 8492 / DSM 6597 / CCUG 4942 / CIP 103695 / JCM 5828 / KCTC 5204 / NCTC 13054 / VPI 0061) TaxID=411479 RepID=A0ABC9NG94_BACUC|nr:hypothetical protein BACUNI_00622 [Bacteroides uniformis ATCC 8492]